jgi:DNA-directed RNA polymerase specialized sigma24 family protein
MDERQEALARLWIRNPDNRGNEVDQRLIMAAGRVWDRARLIVIRYLGDDTDAPQIVETAVHAASRTQEANCVRSLEAYLLRSIAREALRYRRKQNRITYFDSGELENLLSGPSEDLEKRIDDARRLDRVYAFMDVRTRRICDLRRLDYDWRGIARSLGYANGHSAEVQFRKGVQTALKRMTAATAPQERLKGDQDSDDRS